MPEAHPYLHIRNDRDDSQKFLACMGCGCREFLEEVPSRVSDPCFPSYMAGEECPACGVRHSAGEDSWTRPVFGSNGQWRVKCVSCGQLHTMIAGWLEEFINDK